MFWAWIISLSLDYPPRRSKEGITEQVYIIHRAFVIGTLPGISKLDQFASL